MVVNNKSLGRTKSRGENHQNNLEYNYVENKGERRR